MLLCHDGCGSWEYDEMEGYNKDNAILKTT
jgi:hypothetical protein